MEVSKSMILQARQTRFHSRQNILSVFVLLDVPNSRTAPLCLDARRSTSGLGAEQCSVT
jgi:hypothetical protein